VTLRARGGTSLPPQEKMGGLPPSPLCQPRRDPLFCKGVGPPFGTNWSKKRSLEYRIFCDVVSLDGIINQMGKKDMGEEVPKTTLILCQEYMLFFCLPSSSQSRLKLLTPTHPLPPHPPPASGERVFFVSYFLGFSEFWILCFHEYPISSFSQSHDFLHIFGKIDLKEII